ncbi:hypothetical protein LZ30DRAFT_349729 [Colletotrichum cereale]|nr:hypothetical protein LZ30DRAFT_349729 [Colletotrichum cereale]
MEGGGVKNCTGTDPSAVETGACPSFLPSGAKLSSHSSPPVVDLDLEPGGVTLEAGRQKVFANPGGGVRARASQPSTVYAITHDTPPLPLHLTGPSVSPVLPFFFSRFAENKIVGGACVCVCVCFVLHKDKKPGQEGDGGGETDERNGWIGLMHNEVRFRVWIGLFQTHLTQRPITPPPLSKVHLRVWPDLICS